MKIPGEIMGRGSVPLVTPLSPNGDVNLDALARLTEFAVAGNFRESLIVIGPTGEVYSLTDEERVEIRRSVRAAAGRVPLLAAGGRRGAGVGCRREQDFSRLAGL